MTALRTANAGATATANAVATPTPAQLTPQELVAVPTVQLPSSLPRTGSGVAPIGVIALLMGVLAVAVGLTARRTRR